MSAPQPSTVSQVIKRLRGTLGHIGKRDREAVLAGIEAILELSSRLNDATRPSRIVAKPEGGLTVRREPEPSDVEGAPV